LQGFSPLQCILSCRFSFIAVEPYFMKKN